MPIITSMLDTDFYKFTMQQVVFKKFPDVEVEYAFKNRTKDISFHDHIYRERFLKEVESMAKLRFKDSDIKYLKSLGLFSKGYLEYLKRYRFNPEEVNVGFPHFGDLVVHIRGTWLNTILWEVPLLAIISELYSIPKCNGTRINRFTTNEYFTGRYNLMSKLEMIEGSGIRFADFGSRRRFGKRWHDKLISLTTNSNSYDNFIGTSNVYLAKKYNIKPIGTMAHEFIQAMQTQVRLSDSQKYAFQVWADVYRGDLGIALSDTLGMDAFFNDFDMYFAKLFDGARHDSGSPDEWCDRLVKHYISMDIDPKTKTAVFSDGLTFPEMIRLHKKYSNKIKVSFGIGTNLTNDCGIKPLQIVIKMTKCDGKPVAKISDSPGKQMCNNKDYLKYLVTQFKIPERRI